MSVSGAVIEKYMVSTATKQMNRMYNCQEKKQDGRSISSTEQWLIVDQKRRFLTTLLRDSSSQKNEETRNTCAVAVIHVSGIRRNFLKIDPEAKKEKVDTRLEWSFFDKMQAYKRG